MPIGFFFFQAEDGIRDLTVTGVQTCALPISGPSAASGRAAQGVPAGTRARARPRRRPRSWRSRCGGDREIGRASCRGRGEISVVAVSLKKKKKEILQLYG